MSVVVSSRLPEIISTLKLLKNVVALAPLGEHVGAGIELAISICEMAQSAKTNMVAYEELGLRIAALLAGISNVVQKAPEERLPNIRANLEDVIRVLTRAQDTIRAQTTRSSKASKGFFGIVKVLRAARDLEEISALEVKISAALERHQIESNVRLELITQDVAEMMNDHNARLAAIQEAQTQAARDAAMARFDKLTHVAAARYDSHELQDQVTSCLEGTRVDLLAELDAWALSPDGAPLFWLNGLAGTGKSTVARTFCERVTERKDPSLRIVSFFVSRHSTERRKAMNILHTLVYQLALQDDDIRSCVTRVLAQEPDLLSRSLDQQVTKLLDDAVKHVRGPRFFVLVLDALDECKIDSQGREGGRLLLLLARSVSTSGGFLKLLVTSRLESTICEMFDEIQRSTSKSQVLQLHNIDRAVVRNDIRQYLLHSFDGLARRIKTTDWPSGAQVNVLLDNADVLFVYAATVVRYISHRRFDPRKRLEQVLTRKGNSSQSAYRQLDILYQGVLENAMAGVDDGQDEPEIKEQLRTMLATVVLLKQPLSPSSIASLLDWSLHETEITLAQLSAVILVHGDEPVRIFHPSFPDFLLDRSRCTNPHLHFDTNRQQSILAYHTLSLLNNLLHKDMLKTGLNPLDDNIYVLDLSSCLVQMMPAHLCYAVRFWNVHLVLGSLANELTEAFDVFCHDHLFHWLECLSYFGELDTALSNLLVIADWLDDSTPTRDLITDLYYTLREYYSPIRDSAAHIYHSALVTMPMCRLFQLNLHEAGDIILRTPRRASFSPQLTYMQGDVTQLEPFAISPDGSRIACHRYSEIHVGKTASGEMERVPLRLEPSTDVPFLRFCGLHFSKNGRQLLSANTLGDIHIMELDGMEDSWIHLPPAENLDPTLDWHAAFSPAGDHCVFVSGHSPNLPLSVPPPPGSRSRILLRRVQANSDYQLLYATAEDFPSSKAVFTSDAQYVVQAYGHYIVVCDIALGALHVKITPNDTSSGFCHDITTLAAVSNTICASMALDGTVILWDLNQGSYVHTLCKGSDELPRLLTLACSLDGLVLGIVADGIVRSVSTTDGHTIAEHLFPYHQTRNGYTEVPAVVLDVNHSRVYVAAMAEPLFFWSFKKILEPPHASITSSSAVRQMRFSADDQLLMSCTTNSSMTIWQTSTGLRSAECNGKGETLFAALSIPIPRYVISTGIIYEALDAGLRSFFQVNDTKTGKLLRRAHLSSHDSSPILDQFTLSADGRLLVLRLFFRGPHVEDNTGALFILSAYTFAILAQSPDLGSASCKLQYTPDGRTLVQMWPYEGLIVVIDGKNLKVRHTLHFENCSESDDWIVSSCSNRLGRLCSHHANPGRLIVEVWDLGTGLREATAFQLHYDGDENILFQVKAHIWTPTRFLCATSVGIFSDINSVDTQVSHVFHPWPVLWGGPPQAICTSQDQLHIYAWCGDGILRGWATDDFHMERPIIQLATSAFEWPDMPEEYIVVRLALWIAPLNPTCLRAIVRVNMCHSLCLTIDMELERCVNIVFLGDEVNWTLPSGASTEDRLYILQRDPYACLSRLLHIPVSKDDDDDSWLQEADQYSRIFERQVLLHVLDPHTGEINTFLTWCEDSVKLEVIPASSALCKLRYDTRYQKRISSMYNAIDGWLKVYLGQRLLARLYIPPDRRPEGSILPDERFGGLATCDGFVALGSSQGVVSIFDIEKAVKAAKAGEPR